MQMVKCLAKCSCNVPCHVCQHAQQVTPTHAVTPATPCANSEQYVKGWEQDPVQHVQN
jgi:hypothetical protein